MSGTLIRRSFFVLLCGLAATCAPRPAHAQEGQVRWRTDYNFARKEALEKSLPLLIDFFKVPCPPCERLDAEFFRDPRVAAFINERFIPLRVNGMDPANAQLLDILGIDRFPTIVLAAHDGKVLAPSPIIGYRDPSFLHDQLLRVLSAASDPQWMVQSQQQAQKYYQAKDFARAIGLLRTICEDGKTRPVQLSARKLLQEIEDIGKTRLTQALEMVRNRQNEEAVAVAREIEGNYPGLQIASDAARLISDVMQQDNALRIEQRRRKAQELFVQVQEAYRTKEYFICLDRSETLVKNYPDLPEAQDAYLISVNIKNDPQWLLNAGNVLEERLGNVWLALGETAIRNGQPEQARYWFGRVLLAFPSTTHAAHAQTRLNQIGGVAPRGTPAMTMYPPR
jgi:tetratricopeptide (TPR) repeat protein